MADVRQDGNKVFVKCPALEDALKELEGFPANRALGQGAKIAGQQTDEYEFELKPE